jgi:hypothetical protein
MGSVKVARLPCVDDITRRGRLPKYPDLTGVQLLLTACPAEVHSSACTRRSHVDFLQKNSFHFTVALHAGEYTSICTEFSCSRVRK